MLETKFVTVEELDDLNSLFCTNRHTDKCWCMWYIISYKAFQAGGGAQNRASFSELAFTESAPLGVLAYQDGEAVGWCAAGPRERYARGIKTPTYRHKGADDYTNVWLVPCFFTRSDVRGKGLTRRLLEAAVQLAREHGAEAVDGFPFTGNKRRSGGGIHVGFESTFLDCGFEPLRRPSDSRVVMRRIL